MLYMAAKNKGTLVDVSAMGRKGGKARAENLTPEQRNDSARKAVQARWAKTKAKKAAVKKTGGTK